MISSGLARSLTEPSVGLAGPPVVGAGQGMAWVSGAHSSMSGGMWGSVGMHGRTMEMTPPHYMSTPPQLHLQHFICQGDTKRKGGQMEVRARMMRSCGRTCSSLDPLNPFCGTLPLPHLPGEQQRSSRLQAAWGILQ